MKRSYNDDALSNEGGEYDYSRIQPTSIGMQVANATDGESSFSVLDYSANSPDRSSSDSGSLITGGPSNPNFSKNLAFNRSNFNPKCSEDEERKKIRRERNKMAAAKCRQKRVDQTNTLLEETQKLESKQKFLKEDIRNFEKQKEELEYIMQSHLIHCQMKTSQNNLNTNKSCVSINSLTDNNNSINAGNIQGNNNNVNNDVMKDQNNSNNINSNTAHLNNIGNTFSNLINSSNKLYNLDNVRNEVVNTNSPNHTLQNNNVFNNNTHNSADTAVKSEDSRLAGNSQIDDTNQAPLILKSENGRQYLVTCNTQKQLQQQQQQLQFQLQQQQHIQQQIQQHQLQQLQQQIPNVVNPKTPLENQSFIKQEDYDNKINNNIISNNNDNNNNKNNFNLNNTDNNNNNNNISINEAEGIVRVEEDRKDEERLKQKPQSLGVVRPNQLPAMSRLPLIFTNFPNNNNNVNNNTNKNNNTMNNKNAGTLNAPYMSIGLDSLMEGTGLTPMGDTPMLPQNRTPQVLITPIVALPPDSMLLTSSNNYNFYNLNNNTAASGGGDGVSSGGGNEGGVSSGSGGANGGGGDGNATCSLGSNGDNNGSHFGGVSSTITTTPTTLNDDNVIVPIVQEINTDKKDKNNNNKNENNKNDTSSANIISDYTKLKKGDDDQKVTDIGEVKHDGSSSAMANKDLESIRGSVERNARESTNRNTLNNISSETNAGNKDSKDNKMSSNYYYIKKNRRCFKEYQEKGEYSSKDEEGKIGGKVDQVNDVENVVDKVKTGGDDDNVIHPNSVTNLKNKFEIKMASDATISDNITSVTNTYEANITDNTTSATTTSSNINTSTNINLNENKDEKVIEIDSNEIVKDKIDK